MLDFLMAVATAFVASRILNSDERKPKPYQRQQKTIDFYKRVLDEKFEFSIKRERVEDHPEYYEWAKAIAIRLLGLSEEEADNKFMVGTHLPVREYPLSYIDEIMLYHGKLSSRIAYGGFEVPGETYGLKFTQERWDRVVNLANGVNDILSENGIDDRLVLCFHPYRNRDEFKELKLPILYYLDEIDYDFVLDLYMNYGQIAKPVAKINWEAQNPVTPAHVGEERENVI